MPTGAIRLLLASGVFALALALAATGAHRAEDMEAVWGAVPLGRVRGMVGGESLEG